MGSAKRRRLSRSRRDGGALRCRAGEHQRQRGIVVPADGVQPRSIGAPAPVPPKAALAEIVTGVPVSDVLLALRDAGLDIERVEAAGLLQRMQARIAHALEKRRIGIEQPVEPVDQDADRQADRAAPGRAGFRRAPAARAAPASRRVVRSARGCLRGGSGWLDRRARAPRLLWAAWLARRCHRRFRAAPTIAGRVR